MKTQGGVGVGQGGARAAVTLVVLWSLAMISPSEAQSLPDFVVGVSGPPSAGVGTTVAVDTTVTNQGTEAWNGFYVAVYLSADATITPEDQWLGYRYVGSLAGGASDRGAVTVTVPSWAGSYYLGVMADAWSEVSESDESNNGAAQPLAVVTQPDVVAAVDGPPSAGMGTTLAVDTTVTNQGTDAWSVFAVGVYLSMDATITPADTFLGYREVGSLAGGASDQAIMTVMLPYQEGNYYLGAIADTWQWIGESNENNNASVGEAITLTP